MGDSFPNTPTHGRTPKAGARSFFAKLTEAAKAVGSVAASASELLTDKDLRRKGAGFIMAEASKGIQGIQKGIESSAETLGRTARSRFQHGSKSVQSVLKNVERQISEFQRQQQLRDREHELDFFRKIPVDIQIGEQVYEDMPQEMRSRLWYALLDRPELALPFRPITGPKHHASRPGSRSPSTLGVNDHGASSSGGSNGGGSTVQVQQAGSTAGHMPQEVLQLQHQHGQHGSQLEAGQASHAAAADAGVDAQNSAVQQSASSSVNRLDVTGTDASETPAAAASTAQAPASEAGAATPRESSQQAMAQPTAAQPDGTQSGSQCEPPAVPEPSQAAVADASARDPSPERTMSSLPDIDDLLAQPAAAAVAPPLTQPQPDSQLHEQLQASRAQQPSQQAADAAALEQVHALGSAPAEMSGLATVAGTGAAAGPGALPGGGGSAASVAAAGVAPPSATQVLEGAITPEEWQAMAAAAASATAASRPGPAAASSMASTTATTTDASDGAVLVGSDSGGSLQAGTGSNASSNISSTSATDIPSANSSSHISSTTGDGSMHTGSAAASSTSSAAPPEATSHTSFSTGPQGSNSSIVSPTSTQQRTSSSSGSRGPGAGGRASDGGDAEWEVVAKDTVPVLSTSGEVEALETVKSIVQSLSDKDELDRLRTAKQALFEAMLRAPWTPGEGIPRDYDEQCPYALLLRMESPGGAEGVDEVIQRDIHRTFPEHPLFHETGGEGGGQQRLFRLLRAYAVRDAEVGYCQGMAFAAGVLLMYLPEEPAFRLFCRLLEPSGANLRRLYLPGLDPLKAELSRFELLLATHLPALHEHLLGAGLPAVLYASQWLMTVFAAPFPVHFAARLMDIMLLEGNDHVLPRVALAIMEALSEELLALDDFEALITHLKVKPLQWKIHKYRQVIAAAIDSKVSDAELEAAAAVVAAEGVRLGRPPSFRGSALHRRTTTGGGSFHTLQPLEDQGLVGGSSGGHSGDGVGPSGVRAENSSAAQLHGGSSADGAVAAPSMLQPQHELLPGRRQAPLRLHPSDDGRPLVGAEAELAALQAAEIAELDAAFMDMMIEADLLLPGGSFDASREHSHSGTPHRTDEQQQQQQQQ